jgi:uracil-DNA glycosylase
MSQELALPSGVFVPTGSPSVVIVGEAYGQQEALLKQPFVGASGKELKQLLRSCGFDWASECYLTNVFLERPPENNIEDFCLKKRDAEAEYQMERDRLRETWPDFPWPNGYDFAPLKAGKYFRPQKLDALARLKGEIETLRPNLVITAGATPTWAMLNSPKIGNLRGNVAESTLCPGVKVLPVYHPAAILRQWSWRPILIADLMKARDESRFPEIQRPKRELWLEPSLEDLEEFESQHLRSAPLISVDIETAHDQITCIGFATSWGQALVVPFVDRRQPDFNYWPSPDEEEAALRWVRKWLQSPTPKVLQNGTYDLQWIWWLWRCPIQNYLQDTMLMHHAYQPEMEKGLGFMGSVYTNEGSWKLMRRHRKEETSKRDE